MTVTDEFCVPHHFCEVVERGEDFFVEELGIFGGEEAGALFGEVRAGVDGR